VIGEGLILAQVEQADQLVIQLIDIVRNTRDARPHPEVIAAKFEETLSALALVSNRLADLQQFVVLERTEPDVDQMNKARVAWDNLPADRDVRDVKELVQLSPTLDTIYRASVTVTSVHRFGPERLKVAELLGREAARFPRYIGQLVPRRNDKFNTFHISEASVDGMRHIIDELTRLGAIKDFSIMGQLHNKEGKKYWKAQREIPKHWKPDAWRVLRGTVSPEYQPFLMGHWLTAYAYGIARDQFERVGSPFEIYSNVTYELPGDLGGGSSDLDVLVRTPDMVLSIECKSGRVLMGNPTQAAKTRLNAERFDRILDTMEVSLQRIYQLLYFDSAEEPLDTVADAVAGESAKILVTMPRAVRLTIQRVANGQPIDGTAAGLESTIDD
jgi:hypothetical protein